MIGGFPPEVGVKRAPPSGTTKLHYNIVAPGTRLPYRRSARTNEALSAESTDATNGFNGPGLHYDDIDSQTVTMALYESEASRFLRQLKTDNPQLEAEQRRGRAIWWDKAPLNLDRQREQQDSRVAQQPYPYQSRA